MFQIEESAFKSKSKTRKHKYHTRTHKGRRKSFRLSICVYCGSKVLCILRTMEICDECYNKKRACERKGLTLPKLFLPCLSAKAAKQVN